MQSLRNEIASHLELSPRCIQVWFHNRRQKLKNIQSTKNNMTAQIRSDDPSTADTRSMDPEHQLHRLLQHSHTEVIYDDEWSI